MIMHNVWLLYFHKAGVCVRVSPVYPDYESNGIDTHEFDFVLI